MRHDIIMVLIYSRMNGLDFRVLLQGVGKKDWYPRYDSGFFWGQYNRPFGYMLKQHTGDKVYREELDNWDTAYWPRYTTYQTHQSSVNRPLNDQQRPLYAGCVV